MTPAAQRIINEIQTTARALGRLPVSTELTTRRETIRYHFGSYTNALIAAGFKVPDKLTPIICTTCQTTFKPKSRNQKYCSHSCAASVTNLGRTVTVESNLKRRTTRALSTPPKCLVFFPVCKVCNTRFTSSARERKTCSDQCFRVDISTRAVNNDNFGGNRSRNITPYTNRRGLTVSLDSSWEVKMATLLDSICVDWVRPTEPLWYTNLEGKKRRYFPDFYVPAYSLYIDTKNPWRVEQDMDKLTRVTDQQPISLLIVSGEEKIISSVVKQYDSGLIIL